MIETQAFVLKTKGTAEKAFELKTIQLPVLGPKQLRISVEAFGLNYADVMARRGLYREAPPMPCVIGYEVVGTIAEVGTELSQELIGTRVVSFCRFGAYAKDVITEEYAFAPIGDMEAAEALALATQFVTAYYMVERSANVHAGEVVLIHAAAGGVGTALIQLCKLKGAIVIAKVSSPKKMELVKTLGADLAINYTTSDYPAEIQKFLGKERLDVSFNPVAGATFKKDWSLLGSGGRLVLFGGSELSNGKWGILSTLNFVRKMGIVVPIGLMMRSKAILGVNMLKVADNKPEVLARCLKSVVDLMQKNTVKAVSGGCFSADDFTKAQDELESGKSVGKISVKW